MLSLIKYQLGTRVGSNIIFVDKKMDTIKYFSSLIRTSNQWMNYMENVHEMGTISG